jgi:NAD(P)H-dependent flavin oxidoreductase YrpB (nitropropane dioxygenase family)
MREICREENLLQTALAREMGIRVPVFSVGMSWLAGPELAAAVSNAGGCGVVGMVGMTSAEVRTRIRKIPKSDHRSFGVNFTVYTGLRRYDGGIGRSGGRTLPCAREMAGIRD